MNAPKRATQALKFLSRRALEELGSLQASVHELRLHRNAALRLLFASRHAATAIAQRDFWLEFAWADQEYRVAVHRLARFCADHRDGSRR
ncbi:MAG TPA: hypothetical protein VKB72_10040 [Steroidobacteraceae bacterium]|nr:hypothetical protein [Steroidobacteraceae bacterium]